MQTGGHGNDTLMILVPVGVSMIVGVMLFGGPSETLTELDAIVREIAYQLMTLASAML